MLIFSIALKGECETLIQKELFQPGCSWFPVIGLTIKEMGLNNKGNLTGLQN